MAQICDRWLFTLRKSDEQQKMCEQAVVHPKMAQLIKGPSTDVVKLVTRFKSCTYLYLYIFTISE